ncbi:GbsR/MarR family transcriptional regulator [Chlamydiota bacterium]
MDKTQHFIEKMGELSSLFGFTHILGQIYGYLYLSPDLRTLDDIKDRLGVSKATVSLTIRELLKWGAVKKIWKAGSRKDFYSAEADFLAIFNNRLVDALLRRASLFDEGTHLSNGAKKPRTHKNENDKFIHDRLDNIQKSSQKLKKILLVLKDTKKHKLLKKLFL